METERIQLNTLVWAAISVFVLEFAASSIHIPAAFRITHIGVIRILDICLLLWITRYHHKSISILGIDFSNVRKGVFRGFLWSAGFALAALMGGGALFLFGINPISLIRSPLPEPAWAGAIFFLVAGVIGPVAEEIFFRGIIFGFFRRMGFWYALLFSTLIFTSLHATTSGIPITQLVGGIVFAVSFEIEKNLFVPIMIHVLGNLAIFSFSLITF